MTTDARARLSQLVTTALDIDNITAEEHRLSMANMMEAVLDIHNYPYGDIHENERKIIMSAELLRRKDQSNTEQETFEFSTKHAGDVLAGDLIQIEDSIVRVLLSAYKEIHGIKLIELICESTAGSSFSLTLPRDHRIAIQRYCFSFEQKSLDRLE